MFDCSTTCKLYQIVRECDYSHEVVVYSTNDLTDARRMVRMLSRLNDSGMYRIVS